MVTTEILYVESATSLTTKLTRIDSIILALENQLINYGAGNSDTESYSIDDGQVKISTTYRSPQAIAQAIERFEIMRQLIINKLNGRTMALRDRRGLI